MILFQNEGVLELDCIRTMGINVKLDDTAIGHFGTGLKYAISVLLRTNHKVFMILGGEQYDFSLSSREVRGKGFDFIMMNDEQLAFTTEYGKEWEVWMAFRELACNARDEKGSFSRIEHEDHFLDHCSDESNSTFIFVEGEEIEEAYETRDQIFFDSENADNSSRRLECINKPSDFIYYRGVRIAEVATSMTYNILEKITLTEDRTAASIYEIRKIISRYFLDSAPQELIGEALMADPKSFERKELDYNQHFTDTSEDFLAVAGSLYEKGTQFSASARTHYMKQMDIEEGYPPMQMNEVHKAQFERAKSFVREIEPEFEIYEESSIELCETLGQGILGKADLKKGRLYLSKAVFDQGTKQVAATLLEEFYHVHTGHDDYTRELQTLLFDKIMTLAETINGEPI